MNFAGPGILNAAASLVLDDMNKEAQSLENPEEPPEGSQADSEQSGNSSEEMVQDHRSEFADWTYKNVDLLKDRNREMAMQMVGHRSDSTSQVDPGGWKSDFQFVF